MGVYDDEMRDDLSGVTTPSISATAQHKPTNMFCTYSNSNKLLPQHNLFNFFDSRPLNAQVQKGLHTHRQHAESQSGREIFFFPSPRSRSSSCFQLVKSHLPHCLSQAFTSLPSLNRSRPQLSSTFLPRTA